MLNPQYILPIANELVIDLFAGGGGASTGIEEAIGRHVDIAINHNIEAVAMHLANHPQTKHYVSDVFEVDPVEVVDGRPVGMLKPRELYRAQGFKDSYIIDWGIHPNTGERIKLTATASIRMCGNSVCPPMAKAYVMANYKELQPMAEAA